MSAHDPKWILYRAVKPRAILPMVRAGFMLDLRGAAVNTGGIALAAPFFFNRMQRRRNPKHPVPPTS